MPALFTRPCSPPNLWAAFTAVSQSLSCVTSCRTKVAVEPSSDASWRPSASSTSPMTTRAPSTTNKRASAAPFPRAPPLMSITFPLRRSILGLYSLLSVMHIMQSLRRPSRLLISRTAASRATPLAVTSRGGRWHKLPADLGRCRRLCRLGALPTAPKFAKAPPALSSRSPPRDGQATIPATVGEPPYGPGRPATFNAGRPPVGGGDAEH